MREKEKTAIESGGIWRTVVRRLEDERSEAEAFKGVKVHFINGGLVQEMAHIANGRDPMNYVRVNLSEKHVKSEHTSNAVPIYLTFHLTRAQILVRANMLILQESSTDPTGSYGVYAPVDVVAMNVVLNGGDPDYVALLPSGFAILPDNEISNPSSIGQQHGILDVVSGGSLLTVAFQILVDSVPTDGEWRWRKKAE